MVLGFFAAAGTGHYPVILSDMNSIVYQKVLKENRNQNIYRNENGSRSGIRKKDKEMKRTGCSQSPDLDPNHMQWG